MDSLLGLVTLFLLFLLLAALVLIAILAYGYYMQRSRTQFWLEHKADELFQGWRQREIESVRAQQQQIARDEAQVAFQAWKAEFERAIRDDAIKRSESVTVGKITEHIVPFLPDFTYNPKDARFIGSPIDLIVFDGLNAGEVKRVVFVEVKTGESSLSTRERRVRDAIEAGNVEWSLLRTSQPSDPSGDPLEAPEPA
jgi:predicted Holliday junction resolvase-like endonuclease